MDDEAKRIRNVWMFKGNFIPKLLGVEAIVLWPFILFRDREPDQLTYAHEIIHMKQIWRDGVIKFYLWYFIEYVIGRLDGLTHYQAYRQISYEIEAFRDAPAIKDKLFPRP